MTTRVDWEYLNGWGSDDRIKGVSKHLDQLVSVLGSRQTQNDKLLLVCVQNWTWARPVK